MNDPFNVNVNVNVNENENVNVILDVNVVLDVDVDVDELLFMVYSWRRATPMKKKMDIINCTLDSVPIKKSSEASQLRL